MAEERDLLRLQAELKEYELAILDKIEMLLKEVISFKAFVDDIEKLSVGYRDTLRALEEKLKKAD